MGSTGNIKNEQICRSMTQKRYPLLIEVYKIENRDIKTYFSYTTGPLLL